MSYNNHQPAGYCPKCDYPMDPGRCPECGESVSEEALCRLSGGARRRRIRRRLIIVAFIVVGGFGGHYAYRHVDWPSYLPTWLLLELQGDDRRHFATMELWHRLNAGTLSNDNEGRLFSQALSVSAWRQEQLSVVTPRPAGYPVRFGVSLGFLLFGGVSPDTQVEEARVFVDGREIDAFKVTPCQGPYHYNMSQDDTIIPSMAVGVHEVEVVMDVGLVMRRTSPSRSWEYPPKQVRAKARVEVVAKPIEDFVRMVWSAEMADSYQNAHSIQIRHQAPDYPSGRLFVYARGMTIDARGMTTLDGGFDVQFAATNSPAEETHALHLGLPLIDVLYDRDLPDNVCGPNAESVTVRFVPNPQYCLELERKECFGGVIEWIDVPVVRGKAVESYDESNFVSPTRVYRHASAVDIDVDVAPNSD